MADDAGITRLEKRKNKTAQAATEEAAETPMVMQSAAENTRGPDAAEAQAMAPPVHPTQEGLRPSKSEQEGQKVREKKTSPDKPEKDVPAGKQAKAVAVKDAKPPAAKTKSEAARSKAGPGGGSKKAAASKQLPAAGKSVRGDPQGAAVKEARAEKCSNIRADRCLDPPVIPDAQISGADGDPFSEGSLVEVSFALLTI